MFLFLASSELLVLHEESWKGSEFGGNHRRKEVHYQGTPPHCI